MKQITETEKLAGKTIKRTAYLENKSLFFFTELLKIYRMKKNNIFNGDNLGISRETYKFTGNTKINIKYSKADKILIITALIIGMVVGFGIYYYLF